MGWEAGRVSVPLGYLASPRSPRLLLVWVPRGGSSLSSYGHCTACYTDGQAGSRTPVLVLHKRVVLPRIAWYTDSMTTTEEISTRGGVSVRYVEGTEDGVDFDAHYSVTGYSGVAWTLLGWAQIDAPRTTLVPDDDGDGEVWMDLGETELEDDTDRVVAIMVGDDRRFTFDVDEVQVISEDAFCHSCGQVGCSHDGWDRD